MPRQDTRKQTITMLATQHGSPDGLHTLCYKQGEVYKDVPVELSSVFIAKGWAKVYRGTVEEQEKVGKGGVTPPVILPEGVVPRIKLAEDTMSNKELIDYAEAHLGLEPGSIKPNTRHNDVLRTVIALQEDLENQIAAEDAGE